MRYLIAWTGPARCRLGSVVLFTAVGISFLSSPSTQAGEEANAAGTAAPKVAAKTYGARAARTALVMPEAWEKVEKTPLRPGELDQLILRELQNDQIAPARRTTDEEFLRRVSLDLTGHLPLPADVEEFLADPQPNKRARLIEQLLRSEDYARHWAQYWRDVIAAQATVAQPALRLARDVAVEAWLFEQFQANRPWDEIARAMIAAEGAVDLAAPEKSGPAAFLLGHMGADADNERAAETSRLFLGIQIQCAQCHDHPSDIWKRQQFHELAAFFGRTRERRSAANGIRFELLSAPQGEHRMPGLDDSRKATVIHPRFLDGQALPERQSDLERRNALAAAIAAKDNYWFAAAYANRVWGQLMGQSFYQPVDDMGPKKEVVFPNVLVRLAAAFRGEHYDMKAFFRVLLNSEAYQREIRLGESAEQHLRFAAAYPTRLRPEALWQALVNLLGKPPEPLRPAANAPRAQQALGGLAARQRTFEASFKREFNFDPSLKADEVEGSIPQALLLMNNPLLDQRIQARGSNFLARILKAYPKDDEAVQILYLRALARHPTARELDKCRAYVAKIGDRKEAFEDLLWALLNSTEFQTKR